MGGQEQVYSIHKEPERGHTGAGGYFKSKDLQEEGARAQDAARKPGLLGTCRLPASSAFSGLTLVSSHRQLSLVASAWWKVLVGAGEGEAPAVLHPTLAVSMDGT